MLFAQKHNSVAVLDPQYKMVASHSEAFGSTPIVPTVEEEVREVAVLVPHPRRSRMRMEQRRHHLSSFVVHTSRHSITDSRLRL